MTFPAANYSSLLLCASIWTFGLGWMVGAWAGPDSFDIVLY